MQHSLYRILELAQHSLTHALYLPRCLLVKLGDDMRKVKPDDEKNKEVPKSTFHPLRLWSLEKIDFICLILSLSLHTILSIGMLSSILTPTLPPRPPADLDEGDIAVMKSYVSTHCPPEITPSFLCTLRKLTHTFSLSRSHFFFSLQLTLPLMHTFPHRCVPARSPTATRCTAPCLCAACILAISRSWADVLARVSRRSLSLSLRRSPALPPSLATQGVGTYTRSIKAVEKELTTHLAKVYTPLSLPTLPNHPQSSVHPHTGPRTKSIRSAGSF